MSTAAREKSSGGIAYTAVLEKIHRVAHVDCRINERGRKPNYDTVNKSVGMVRPKCSSS